MTGNGLPLVGRRWEQAVLLTALAETTAGKGGLVLISGEAGVGKSRLIDQLLNAADRAIVAVGRCPGPGQTAPYGPWSEVAAALSCADRAVSPQPQVSHPLEGQTLRQQAVEIMEWLHQFTAPVLVVLEDIHWSDPASLELLRHMAALLARSRVLLIASYRSDEIHREHPLWALLPDLHRNGAVTMPLDRLDLDGVCALVDAALDLPAGRRRELARELHLRTNGLPLMLCELIKAAQRSGGTLPAEGMLPGTVLQAIDLRLSRLSADALHALTAAALIGKRFDYALLAATVDLSEDALADALDQAISHYLIRSHGQPGDQFEFDHALVREALLSRQIAPRRRRWHIRIAEALLTTANPDPDAVAFHLSQADDPRAVEWLLTSGDRALRLGALAQARCQYERALQLIQGPDRRRGALLLKLGHTIRYRSPDQAQAYLEEAQQAASEAGDAAVLVWVRHHLLLLPGSPGDERRLEAMEQLAAEQQALLGDARYLDLEAQLFGQPCGYPRIAGERAVVLARTGRFQESQAACQELRRIARPGPHLADLDDAELWHRLWVGSWPHSRQALTDLRDARLRLKQYPQAASLQYSLYFFTTLYRADHPDEVDAAAQELANWETLAQERSGQGTMCGGYSPLGAHQFYRGDWESARRNLLEYFRVHPEDHCGQRRWAAAELALALDELNELRHIVEGYPPDSPDEPRGTYVSQIPSLTWRARYYLTIGEPTQARRWLDTAEGALAAIPSDIWAPGVQVTMASYHRATGDLAAARNYALQAVANCERVGLTLEGLEAWRTAGEILTEMGDLRLAEEHLRHALSKSERCRMPLAVAQSQLALGLCLRGRSQGRALIVASRKAFARLGASRYLKQADCALAGLTEVAVTVQEGPLTAREMEIALLVAKGLTDREIGAQLFISPKTVDRHLRNIFAKVQIGNRSSLVAYVARSGMLR